MDRFSNNHISYDPVVAHHCTGRIAQTNSRCHMAKKLGIVVELVSLNDHILSYYINGITPNVVKGVVLDGDIPVGTASYVYSSCRTITIASYEMAILHYTIFSSSGDIDITIVTGSANVFGFHRDIHLP